MIATGSYTGDGTNGRVIATGLPGLLKFARVVGGLLGGGTPEAIKYAGMSPGFPAGFVLTSGSLFGTGFTLAGSTFIIDDTGTGGNLNAVGVDYYWIAGS